MAKEYFLEGDDYYDSPEDEHGYKKHKVNEPVVSESGDQIYPCYVYDKDGKLLRIEYPKKSKGIKGKQWTSRY